MDARAESDEEPVTLGIDPSFIAELASPAAVVPWPVTEEFGVVGGAVKLASLAFPAPFNVHLIRVTSTANATLIERSSAPTLPLDGEAMHS